MFINVIIICEIADTGVQQNGGPKTPLSKIGSTKWLVKPTSLANSPKFGWKTSGSYCNN